MLEKAEIRRNQALIEGFYLLELAAPQTAATAQPGQFVMLSVGESYEPFLKRPMGLNGYDRHSGLIRIIYELRGRGTRLLAQQRPGARLEVLGPLGHGWQLPPQPQQLLLVGGGTGVFPLLPLACEAVEAGHQLTIALGARNRQQLFCLEEFRQLANQCLILATQDGSAGRQGTVLAALPEGQAFAQAYACGPEPMLQAMAAWAAQRELPCQVSLEAHMGCGVGTCMGCVCGIKQAEGAMKYERVCKEGPVFDAQEVVW